MGYLASRISRCSIRSIAGSKLRKLKWAILVKLSDRVVEPVERLSEILFGLIMALTITGRSQRGNSGSFSDSDNAFLLRSVVIWLGESLMLECISWLASVNVAAMP